MENIAPGNNMAHQHPVPHQSHHSQPANHSHNQHSLQMPLDDPDLEDYRSTLNELERNSKPQILLLTELADDYHTEQRADRIVDLIINRLYNVPISQKLTVLYLIDSLCKNSTKNYRMLFQNNIVRIFGHVYERLDTADRQNKSLMLKLRCTWDGIFDVKTMSLLDQTMRGLDPSWSVPRQPAQSGGVVPSTALSQHNIHVSLPTQQQPLIQQQQQQQQQQRLDVTQLPPDGVYSKRKSFEQAVPPPSKKSRGPDSIADPRKPTVTNVPGAAGGRKKAMAQAVPQHPPPPNDLIPLGAAHHTSVVNRKQPEPMLVKRNEAIIQNIKSSRQSRQPVPSDIMTPDMGGVASKAIASTTIPDSKIFTQAPPAVAMQQQAQFYRSNIHAPPPPHQPVHYAQQAPPTYAQSQHTMGHVRGSHSLPPQASQLPPLPAPGSQQQTLPPPPQPQPVHHGHHRGPAPLPVPDSIVILINEADRRLFFLDNKTALVVEVGDSNKMFDQLIHIEPSILRPRQIEFDGDYVTVFIDENTPNEKVFTLDFRQTHPILVYLPGIQHAQEFQIGLPSRELIINGKGYTMKFGGPPIEIWFDDDKFHSVRLSDANPLLRTSEAIRYDLWKALIDKYAPYSVPPIQNSLCQPPPPQQHHSMSLPPQQQVPMPPIYPPPQQSHSVSIMPQLPPVVSGPATTNKSLDINTLLSKIQTSGLLPTNGSVPPVKIEAGLKGKKKTATGGTAKGKKVANKASVGQSNSEKSTTGPNTVSRQYLNIDAAELKKEHEFVVEQYYLGGQCTNCSLRFSSKDRQSEVEGKKSKYARHLDWHFRMNSREKSNSAAGAARRQLFLTESQWLQFKEIFDDEEEEFHADGSGGIFSNTPKIEFPLFKSSIEDYGQFIEAINYKPNDEDLSKNSDEFKAICTMTSDVGVEQRCTICNDKMESKWNVDFEEWRLLDCVKYRSPGESNHEIYHTNCLKELLLEDRDETPRSLDCDLEKPPTLGVIPGLDDSKFDDSFPPELSFEFQDAEMSSLDMLSTSNTTSAQNSEIKPTEGNIEEEIDENEKSKQVKLEEVFEIEIPVIEEVKDISSNDFKDSSQDSKLESLMPKSPESVGESKVQETSTLSEVSKSSKTKKKTGGIVIRMKKNIKPNDVSESSNDAQESDLKPTEIALTSDIIKQESIDDECSRSSFSDGFKNSSPIKEADIQSHPEALTSIGNGNEVIENTSNKKEEFSVEADAKVNSPQNEEIEKETHLPGVNYLRKGEEMSGLCTIM